MEITKALQQFGLTENESKIYLACLALGRAKGQEIAQKSGVPRTTTYTSLEMLAQKHLVSFVDERKVREYVPIDPTVIADKSEEATRALKRALPELSGLLHNATKRYRIRYYDGLQEVKTMYDNILKQRGLKEYLVIGSESSWLKLDTQWFKDFMKRRATANIKTRLILEDSEEARTHQREGRATNSEVRILPTYFEERGRGSVCIFLDRTLFLDYTKRTPFGAEIESREVASMQRLMFETIWKTLPLPPG